MFLKLRVSFCLVSVLFVGNAEAQQTSLPNIILIVTDDQGYADVGFNGSIDIPTPNIDQIAHNGVIFEEGYVTYAVCGPSRAGLITGRYQDKFGFSRNPLLAVNDPDMGLPLLETTLADATRSKGYVTKAIGKWHLGAHESLHPLKRGFDEFYGFLSGGHRYFPEEWTLNDLSEAKDQWDGYRTKLLNNRTRVTESEYLTDALSREAVSFIARKADEPFFLYLAYNAPHAPLQATQKYLDRFPNIQDKKRKTYAAMVSAVDDGVGMVVDALRQSNALENTLIIFLSDNGGPEKVNASDNGLLRGGKGDFYEGGVRVPFAMQWSAKIPKGIRYDKPIISLDIFATIANIIDYTPSAEKPLDGMDLLPFILNENSGFPHEYLYWRNVDTDKYAVRGKVFKIWGDNKTEELYNIYEDLSEKYNLIEKNQNEFQGLQKARQNWTQQLMEPLFLGLLQDDVYDKNHPNRWKSSAN